MKLSSFSLAVLFGLIMTCSSAEAAPAMSPVSARPSKTEAKTKANTAKTDNTLLIKFAAGVDLSSAKKLLQDHGFKVKKVFKNLSAAKGHAYISVEPLKKDAGVLSAQEIQTLTALSEIDSAELNYGIHLFEQNPYTTSITGREINRAAVKPSTAVQTVPTSVPNDPRYSELWGMQNMDMEAAWDIETGSQEVVVFVIDTGIDTDHPDLVSNLWSNPGEIPSNGIDDDGNGYVDDVHGIDSYFNTSNPEDDYGHGTHVAGTIGADGNNASGVVGVNWDVKIGACKPFDAGGGSVDGATEGAVECFDYVLGLKNAGVNVVATNNSWGLPSFSQVLHDAIEANIAAGILPVIAAGNNADNDDLYPKYPCVYTFPNMQGDSLCVAAIDSSNNLAWFSSYGATSVDVAAPGVDILSTVPEFVDSSGYGFNSGTSMATPHVTGLAALLAANGATDLAAIRNAILGGSVPVDSLDGKVATGGKVNGYISLNGHFPPSVSITSPASRSVVNGNVSIEAEASSDYGIAQVEFFVNDSSVGIDSTAPYSVTWDASSSAPDMYTVKAVATDIENAVSSKQIKVYMVNGSDKALILDLGSDNHSGEAVGAALARNNVRPEFGSSITVIDPTVYPRTFVCLGYFPGHVLNGTESADLSAYLDNGGKLYMEGGETWAYDQQLPIHDYFGIKGVADGTADLATVSGISGSIVDGISFASVGVNTYVDHLEPENGGTAIWQNSSPVYINGISNQTETYRTIGCSFEFGNISDKAIQTQVMAAYLSFFGLNSYTVTPSAGTGGSINPDTPQTVPQGETTSFAVTPDIGYTIDQVEGCGGILSGTTYTTGAINADCTVTASFKINIYTVTPSAGEHGSINPDTPQTVPQGETTSFAVTPDIGYAIDKVEGCGGTLSGTTYTTGEITEDCTVTASFKLSHTWRVFPWAGHGGRISPSRTQRVEDGETTSFTITPKAGYGIRSVSGCGGSLSGTTYTTGPITQSCVVRAWFKKLPKHFVIPFADRHGSISPHRPQKVLHGETTSFSVTPKSGYVIKSVSGCGGSLDGNTYTTGPITHTCMVRASFSRN